MLDVILVTSDRLDLFLIKSSSFFDVFASLRIFTIPGNMEDFSGFARNLDLIYIRPVEKTVRPRKYSNEQLALNRVQEGPFQVPNQFQTSQIYGI